MTNSIPLQDVSDTAVIARVVMGILPNVTDNARMSLIQELCSLMTKCWSNDPDQRPTAADCRKSIGSMVSDFSLRLVSLNRPGFRSL